MFQKITMMSTTLSQEEEQFLRYASIIFGLTRDNLLQLFRQAFHKQYCVMYGDNTVSGNIFLGRVRPKLAHVTAALQNGDSSKFDLTTLFFCFLNSKSLTLTPTEVRAITDLRELRNSLAHSSSDKLSQTDLTTKENELTTIYQNLNWSTADLHKYATTPLQTDECHKVEIELLRERNDLKSK